MQFRCPFCSYIIRPDDRARGYSMKCPSCSKTVLVPITAFEVGCILGDFEIESKIGKGSIGTVYRAKQISLDRVVALKILSPDYTNTKGIADFLKEARAAAKLSHQNLVQSLAVGEEDGTCYMAMTYLTGESVKAKLERERKIPVDEALHIIQQVAEALYYAWDEAKLIHRDVKPDNIMITENGIVKLTDLGLAMHQKDWKEDMEISGSPSYMSPEQFAGEKLDTRSDIYSLGITLYQMASGQLPFRGETLKTVAAQHFEEEAVPLNKLDPAIPSRMASMVSKMMAKHPSDRYSSIEELLNEIWTIRQKTAPNKDLVPDVHTISINRLDYYLQNAPSKNKEPSKEKSKKIKLNSLQKALAVSLPFLLIVFIVLAVFVVNKKYKAGAMRNRIDNFKAQMDKPNANPDLLLKNAREILAQFGPQKTNEEEALYNLMLYYTSKLENTKLSTEVSSIRNEKEKSKKEIASLKDELNKSAHPAETKPPPAATPPPVKSSDAELHTFKNENIKLKSSLTSLASENKKIKEDWENNWKNDINTRMYSLIGKNALKETGAVLKMELERKKEYSKWFEERIALVNKLDALYESMAQSGSKTAGTNIDDFGKVVKIDSGELHYQSQTGKIRITRLLDLPPENLYIIAKEIQPDANESELKANIGLISGNIGFTLKQTHLNKTVEEICSSVIAQSLESIKFTASVDKKRAAARAKALKKQLEGTAELKKIKGELKNILDQSQDE